VPARGVPIRRCDLHRLPACNGPLGDQPILPNSMITSANVASGCSLYDAIGSVPSSRCPLERRHAVARPACTGLSIAVGELQGRHISWQMTKKRQEAAKRTTGSEERLKLEASCPLI
jgi:hypothetical protein